MSEPVKAYILMGLKHCGKSTQAKIIAEKTGIPFVDTDVMIEQKMQMSARDIYKKKGVGAYAVAEEEACTTIAENYTGKSVIVAAGGGICDNPPALNALRSVGNFVFLNLDIEYLISRVENRIKMVKPGVFENAPAYVLSRFPHTMDDVHQILVQKFQDRIDQYLHIADIVIHLRNEPIEGNTNQIMSALF